MEIDATDLERLRREVERVFGSRIRATSDFNRLSLSLRQTCGSSLGLTTIKRLWGYVSNDIGHSFHTLSLLSRYAGYEDWEDFLRGPGGRGEDSGFTKTSIINSAALPAGTVCRVRWNDGKGCTLRKSSDPDCFAVVKADNIKLRRGDVITVPHMAVGQKFITTSCSRNGQSLGAYTGAARSGILDIEINESVPD